MTLLEIQNNLLALLNKANQAGAFTLEDSNAAIVALNGLAQLINQQQQAKSIQTMDAPQDPPPFPPVVPTNP